MGGNHTKHTSTVPTTTQQPSSSSSSSVSDSNPPPPLKPTVSWTPCERCIPPLVVGIGGPTRSGKSTLADRLHEHFGSTMSSVIHQDKYFSFRKPFHEPTGYDNWEVPEALDFDRFLASIRSAKLRLTIMCDECRTKHQETTQSTECTNALNLRRNVLFVEGFLLFINSEVVDLFDRKIFISISRETCHKRRQSTTPVPEDYFEQILWPSYLELNSPHLLRSTETELRSMELNFSGFVLNGERPPDDIKCDALRLVESALEFSQEHGRIEDATRTDLCQDQEARKELLRILMGENNSSAS